ncbi:hypothetical protein WP1_255 [Pseudomonas phage WP1]
MVVLRSARLVMVGSSQDFAGASLSEVVGGSSRQDVQRGSGVTLHQVEKSAEIRQVGRSRIDELVVLSRVPGRHCLDLIVVEGRPGEQERAEVVADIGALGHCRVGEVGRLAGDVHYVGGGPAEGGGHCLRIGRFRHGQDAGADGSADQVNWLVFGFQVTVAWASCGSVFLRISVWMIDAMLSIWKSRRTYRWRRCFSQPRRPLWSERLRKSRRNRQWFSAGCRQ